MPRNLRGLVVIDVIWSTAGYSKSIIANEINKWQEKFHNLLSTLHWLMAWHLQGTNHLQGQRLPSVGPACTESKLRWRLDHLEAGFWYKSESKLSVITIQIFTSTLIRLFVHFNMLMVSSLLWLGTTRVFPYPWGLLHWHQGNHATDPVPVKQSRGTLQWRHNKRDGVSNHQLHDCLPAYSGADQRKHQSSASLAFVWSPVNSPYKWPVTRKVFPFDDVIVIRVNRSYHLSKN